MPNIEDKFQAFLRESVSPESSTSSRAVERVESDAPLKPMWWMKSAKRSDTLKDSHGSKKEDEKQGVTSTHSSTSSSMAEFLEKERLCREGSKPSVLDDDKKSSSTTIVDYTDEFTDDDISSIMDQLSLLAGSGLDNSEKSVDDILREAEEEVLKQKSPEERVKGADYAPPPPLLKPSSQLITVNLQEKVSSSDKNNLRTDRELGLNLNKIDAMRLDADRVSVDNDADKIFDLIDKEVKKKIAAGKTSSSIIEPTSTDISLSEPVSSDQSSINTKVKKPEPSKRSFSPFRGELSTVVEESVSDFSLEVEVPAKPAKGSQSSKSSQDGGSQKNATFSFERELIEERHKYQQMKSDLDQKVNGYKNQVDLLKRKYEEERFVLEKDVYLLRAKLKEYEQQHRHGNDKGGGDCGQERTVLPNDHRLKLLEGEVQKQEQLIVAYQKENVKLCDAMKQLKKELKAKDTESVITAPLSARTSVALASEREALLEKVKKKDEIIETLNVEIDVLKNVKLNVEKTAEELKLSNTQLTDEVERLEKLLTSSESNKNITKKSSSKSNNDAAKSLSILEKKLEEQKSVATNKDAEIESLKRDLQRVSDEVEARKETMTAVIVDSRGKAAALETKISELQVALEKERSLAHELNEDNYREKMKMQGLDRQLKEMEEIVRRNCDNKESATKTVEDSVISNSGARIKYLESRICQLEADLESAKSELDIGIKNIQKKYIALKEKYEHNVANLSLELSTWKNEANIWKEAAEMVKSSSAASLVYEDVRDPLVSKRDAWQMVRFSDLEVTEDSNKKAPLTIKDLTSSRRHIASHLGSGNARAVKEDAHLLATIRGLNHELDAKRKDFRILEKKLSDANQTNKRLQAEREKFLSQHTSSNPTGATAKGSKKARDEKDNQYEMLLERLATTQETITSLQEAGRDKDDQIQVLMIEYRQLGEKRLQDLEELQKEHIAEMSQLASDNSARNTDPRLYDMKEQILTQQQVINRLREQLKQLDDCQAEIMVLKVEREHLEKSLVEANRKVSNLRLALSPGQEHTAILQDKMEQLELRHECREQKLQGIVRDLLRQIQASGGSDDASALREKLLQKNREICFYKTEVDKYIARVMEVEEMLSTCADDAHSYVITH